MRYVMQILSGTVGAVGFALLFNVRGKRIWLIALGSALSCGIFLGLRSAGAFYPFFCGACGAALFSEVLARTAKAPVLLFLVPMLIPLIPGSTLYYAMSYLVNNDSGGFLRYAKQLLTEAGAIALGIISTSAVTRVFLTLLQGRRTHDPKGDFLPKDAEEKK